MLEGESHRKPFLQDEAASRAGLLHCTAAGVLSLEHNANKPLGNRKLEVLPVGLRCPEEPERSRNTG